MGREFILETTHYRIESHSTLETQFLSDPLIQQGLAWGEPRKHHSEGSVGAHVQQIHEYIDKQAWTEKELLYVLATVHDTFKSFERTTGIHHAIFASDYYLRNTGDARGAQVLQHHDTAWSFFKKARAKENISVDAFTTVFGGLDLELLIKFMIADRCTRENDTVSWFENALRAHNIPNIPERYVL